MKIGFSRKVSKKIVEPRARAKIGMRKTTCAGWESTSTHQAALAWYDVRAKNTLGTPRRQLEPPRPTSSLPVPIAHVGVIHTHTHSVTTTRGLGCIKFETLQ